MDLLALEAMWLLAQQRAHLLLLAMEEQQLEVDAGQLRAQLAAGESLRQQRPGAGEGRLGPLRLALFERLAALQAPELGFAG